MFRIRSSGLLVYGFIMGNGILEHFSPLAEFQTLQAENYKSTQITMGRGSIRECPAEFQGFRTENDKSLTSFVCGVLILIAGYLEQDPDGRVWY